MPITFDTLEELKAFYRTFKLEEKPGSAVKKAKNPQIKVVSTGKKDQTPKKRGRPAKNTAKKLVSKPAAKRGPKPKKAVAVKAKTKKVVSVRDPQNTLTAKIRESIQSFLRANRSFTANDIYADISTRDKSVNKQSVITSVLKQMNSTFKNVPVTDRPGAGPRAVKFYNP